MEKIQYYYDTLGANKETLPTIYRAVQKNKKKNTVQKYDFDWGNWLDADYDYNDIKLFTSNNDIIQDDCYAFVGPFNNFTEVLELAAEYKNFYKKH